jgi:hypothetical protein
LVASIYKFLLVLAASLESLVLAFLCTILLMFFSRRATLRQVNAQLAVISHQLTELRQPPGHPPGSSSGQARDKGGAAG